MAALKLLSPAKLNVLINLLREALPLAEMKALENFKLRMAQEGIIPEKLIEYLSTGKINPIDAFTTPATTKTNSIETKSEKLVAQNIGENGSVYLSKADMERRDAIIKDMVKQDCSTKETLKALEEAGIPCKKTSLYSLRSLAKKEIQAEYIKNANEKKKAELKDSNIVDLKPTESTIPAPVEKNQNEDEFIQEEPTAHYVPDDEEIEAEREFMQKAHEHHQYY